PMGIAGGLNTYGFGGGDAVNNRDPSGMTCITTTTPVYLVTYSGGVETDRSLLYNIVSYSGDCGGDQTAGGGGPGRPQKNSDAYPYKGVKVCPSFLGPKGAV